MKKDSGKPGILFSILFISYHTSPLLYWLWLCTSVNFVSLIKNKKIQIYLFQYYKSKKTAGKIRTSLGEDV